MIETLLQNPQLSSQSGVLKNLEIQAVIGSGDIATAKQLMRDIIPEQSPPKWAINIVGAMQKAGQLSGENLTNVPAPIRTHGWLQLTYDAYIGREAQALDWISSNVPRDLQVTAAGAFFSHWINLDPNQAASVIDKLPQNEIRIAGIKNLVGYLRAKGDAVSAESWASQIPNN